MNIDLPAGKLRGYACAECFRPTVSGADGYHLIVHKTSIPLLSVNEDLHRACGDAILARGIEARTKLEAAGERICVHCSKPCVARCAGSKCRRPCCFRGACLDRHASECKQFEASRT